MSDPVDTRVRSSPSFVTMVTLVAASALALPLFGYGYLGVFTRHIADDYCAGRNLSQHGFWGSQIWTYENHSGRAFSYFVRITAEFFGQQRVVPFLAVILLIFWLGATTWTFCELARLRGWRHRFLNAVILAELLVFAMLRTGPDQGQSFFWEAGSLTYTLPIILITLFLGLFLYDIRQQPRRTQRVMIGALAGTICFCAAATSETNAAVQCVGFLAAVLICQAAPTLTVTRRWPALLYVGLWTSLISAIVVILAPGNAVRENGVRKVAPRLPFGAVITKSVWGSAVFVVHFVHHRPAAALTLMALPALIAWSQKSSQETGAPSRVRTRMWLLAYPFSFTLIVASILPGVFALSDMPPERAEFIAHWILLTTLIGTGISLGTTAGQRFGASRRLVAPAIASFAIVLLVISWALKSTKEIAAAASEASLYAAEWDAEDAQIRKLRGMGESNIVVPWNQRIASGGNVSNVPWLSSDPTYWVNTCTADYYGIASLRVANPDFAQGK